MLNLLSDLKIFPCPIVFNQDGQLVVDYRLQLLPYVFHSDILQQKAMLQMIYLGSRASVQLSTYPIRFYPPPSLFFVVLHLMNPNKMICIKSPVDPDPLLSTKA